MRNRSPLFPALVWLVPIAGMLIFWFGWYLSTKNEMNEKYGTKCMTGWIILVPFLGGLLFAWSYAGGVAKVTNGKYSQVVAFLLMFLIFPVGGFLIQSAFNETSQGQPGNAMQRAA